MTLTRRACQAIDHGMQSFVDLMNAVLGAPEEFRRRLRAFAPSQSPVPEELEGILLTSVTVHIMRATDRALAAAHDALRMGGTSEANLTSFRWARLALRFVELLAAASSATSLSFFNDLVFRVANYGQLIVQEVSGGDAPQSGAIGAAAAQFPASNSPLCLSSYCRRTDRLFPRCHGAAVSHFTG